MKKKVTKKNTENTFTTVKTSYARAALVLLALNFCLTAYVIVNMSEATQEVLEGVQQAGSAPIEQLAETN